MRNVLTYLAARLKEPSSWAGIAGLLTAGGVAVAPEQWGAIVTVGTGLAGLAAVLVPEKAAKELSINR